MVLLEGRDHAVPRPADAHVVPRLCQYRAGTQTSEDEHRHDLKRRLRALLADATAWELVSFQRIEDAPGTVARLYPRLA